MSNVLRADLTSAIRMLAADAVEKANSGHPGAPMGQADLALVLWDEFLRFDPDAPQWPGRDRFVLSCGHASMLQYALLHLYGFNLSIGARSHPDIQKLGTPTALRLPRVLWARA